jgi:hypothetical protein
MPKPVLLGKFTMMRNPLTDSQGAMAEVAEEA